MNENEPMNTCRESGTYCQNRDLAYESPGRSMAVTCLLVIWQSSLSWHDSYLGSITELGKSFYYVKRKAKQEVPARLIIEG